MQNVLVPESSLQRPGVVASIGERVANRLAFCIDGFATTRLVLTPIGDQIPTKPTPETATTLRPQLYPRCTWRRRRGLLGVETNMKYSPKSAIPKQPIAAIVVDRLVDTPSFPRTYFEIQRPRLRANTATGAPAPTRYPQQETQSELGAQVAVDFQCDTTSTSVGVVQFNPGRHCAT